MKKNNNVIFFGNGLNRIQEGLDWNKLLDEISGGKILKDIPLPFQYEDICLSDDAGDFDKGPSCSVGEDELKQRIVDKLSIIHSNDVYEALAKMPINDYITTNYDKMLEKTLSEMGYEVIDSDSDSSESRYSIHRYNTLKKGDDVKRIWYIHGNIDKHNSIIMGYDQYCGELSKMDDWVKGSYKIIANEPIKAIHSRFPNTAHDDTIKSWIDLFFTSNVHIIGYSMPFDEIDLWWLLDKRKRLIWEGRMATYGTIRFYDAVLKSKKKKNDKDKCQEKENKEKRIAKYKLLDILDVRHKFQGLNDKKEFADYYKHILADIQNN